MRSWIIVIALSSAIGATTAIVTGSLFSYEVAHLIPRSEPLDPPAKLQASQEQQVRLAAEFDPVDSILVSERLVRADADGVGFVEALLDDGHNVIILTDESSGETEEDDLFSIGRLKEFRNQILLLSVPHSSAWVRDFGPFAAGVSMAEGGRSLYNFTFRSPKTLDDTVPYMVGLYLESDVIHVGLELDGGNFLTDSEHCLVGAVDEALSLQWRQRARTLFPGRIGCKRFNVIDGAPHEHIDMYAKFSGKNTLLLNSLDHFEEGWLKQIDKELGSLQLDKKSQLQSLYRVLSKTFKVKKLPQPLPLPGIERTYSNALLANGFAYVPRYRKPASGDGEYPDVDLLADLEARAAEVYQGEGYQVRFVDADEFIADGGALHCLAITIPALKLVE